MSSGQLTLVFDRDDEVCAWVAARLPLKFTPEEFGPCATIGMADKNGKLVAGCVYNKYTGWDMHVTFASITPRWTLPQNVTPLFHYPFVQRACTRLTLIIGANNVNAIRTNLRLGFEVEGRHPRAYDGVVDAISLGMLRENCKWIAR